MTAQKLDLLKVHKSEYVTPKSPKLVETGPAHYLTISGRGAPGGELFSQHVNALYNVAYTIKFGHKAKGDDYVVCKLEGLWWGWDPEQPSTDMNWKLLIRVPDFVSQADVDAARLHLLSTGKTEYVKEVRLEEIDEGRCVQMLHVGAYDKEPETITAMVKFAEGNGYEVHGHHHEIYLSDPGRVPQERWRTILRLPVRPSQ